MAKIPSDAHENVPEDEGLGLLEDGWYTAEIVKSEMRDTNAGDGRYLWMQLQLTEDNNKYAGRVLFDRLNLVNKNATAVAIAKRTFQSIERAIGLTHVDDSEEMHGRPMLVKVRTRPARGEYEASNEIKAYRAVAEGAPSSGTKGWM